MRPSHWAIAVREAPSLLPADRDPPRRHRLRPLVERTSVVSPAHSVARNVVGFSIRGLEGLPRELPTPGDALTAFVASEAGTSGVCDRGILERGGKGGVGFAGGGGWRPGLRERRHKV